MVALVRCQTSVRCPECHRMTVPHVDVLASVAGELRHLVCPEPSNLAGAQTPAGEASLTTAQPDERLLTEAPSHPDTGAGAFLRGEAA
jgi:hypothetical protein